MVMHPVVDRGDAVIVDCFLFYNELELLEIRLQELAGVVSGFLLVEAGETFTGKAREMVFEQHQDRFSDFRIACVKVPRFPANLISPWDREAFLRDTLMEGLRGLRLAPSDLVLLSDLDEIPRAAAVEEAAALLNGNSREGMDGECLVFEQRLSYYYLNSVARDPWHGTRMARFGDLRGIQTLRASPGTVVKDGGWHFSYLGGPARIREKIQAYSHTENDLPEFTSPEHIQHCIVGAQDLLGRDMGLKVAPLDFSYPRYVLQNQERFAPFMAPAVSHVAEAPRATSRVSRQPALREPTEPMAPTPYGLYQEALGRSSDIVQHLPYLYRLAFTVERVTEFGTRSGQSTAAFLLAGPTRLECYDLERGEALPELEAAAKWAGIDFRFHLADVREVEIEPTDLLFIDTWHVEEQMQVELSRHAGKVSHYLVLHDTETFGMKGETPGHRGIWGAVAGFMRSHPEWRLLQHFPNNNGLTVFMRISGAK